MNLNIPIGASGSTQERVVSEHLVSSKIPEMPPVFATPWMLFLMEHAAYLAVQPHLPDGQVSVGVGFEFQHTAPTPAGHTVTAHAEVTAVEGRLVTLTISARDDHDEIGRGTHTRAVIDVARFREKLKQKTG